MGSQTSFDPQRRCLFLNTSLDGHLTFSGIVVGPIIVVGLQFLFYGFYCAVIRLALRELRRSTMKIREYQFHRNCLLTLFILASINVPASTVKVTGCSAYGFYTLQHLDVPNLTTLSFVADVFTDLILVLRISSTFADAILIFRCYAVWGFRLSIVIAPIIGCIAVEVLGMTMLGFWLRYGTDEPWFSQTQLGADVYLIGNACMNIFLTLMIAGRIWWTAREARTSLSERHFRLHKMISLLILGSGILFPIALVCDIFFNVSSSLSYGWDLKPLLIQVAVGVRYSPFAKTDQKNQGHSAYSDNCSGEKETE
ncbi:hypothetical protein Moror_7550 [Moniliophthora roreri MCA 2997]|uniref:Uncharacterized protein n=1 Tax=Moniliophthora roreri (strain MCA 2997) TaxID=1381753 RepID=V2WTN8_MONRO|nr:hypothetical protein Moror_7550 [Moniliophthora roreri MCA 2997]